MKLPGLDLAKVSKEKVADYLLSFSHRTGKSKAEFFGSFGFSPQRWDRLAHALVQHAAVNEETQVDENPFGRRYTIEGELDSPDGRRPLVRVVWFIESGEEAPRLVTAYPCKVKVGHEGT